MGKIILDRSGDLRLGYFYELHVPREDEPDRLWITPDAARCNHGEILVWRSPRDDQLAEGFNLRAEVYHPNPDHIINLENEYRCGSDPTHITATYWHDVPVRLRWGPEHGDLISCDGHGNRLVLLTERIVESLRATPFTGYRLEPVQIDQVGDEYFRVEEHHRRMKLWDLQFLGRRCRRPYSVVDAPNACPFCGHEPLICAECGNHFDKCARCEKYAWVIPKNHKGAGDPRLLLTVEGFWGKTQQIVEARKWDGSDFIYEDIEETNREHIVTRRVVDWLLSIHAAPFFARPVPVDVTGAPPETLAILEAAKTLPATKP
jgi:hypothetical protein